MSHSSSSSSSSSSHKPAAKQEPGYAALPTDNAKAEYPNNNGIKPRDFQRKGFSCCSCLSFVWQIITVVSSGSFLFGFNLSLLNTSISAISVNYDWCERDAEDKLNVDCTADLNYVAFMSTAVFIGAAVGSMTGGSFIKMGRRKLLLMSMAIFIFGIVSSVVANSFSSLLWARLVVGYAVGLVSVVVPTYMSEMTPADKRGTYGVSHQLQITVGIFIAVLIGLPLDSPDGVPGGQQDDFDKIWWRIMLGLGLIPVLLCGYLLMYTYTFETPNWYLENHQADDAANLLKLIYGKDDVSTEVGDVQRGLNDSIKAQSEGLTLFKAMRQGDYFHVIFVGCLLSAFQQLGGINVFIASSNALFASAGFEGAAVTGFSIALTGINVICTFPAMYLIEKLGRKTLLMIGTIGQTAGVLPAAICYWVDESAEYTKWLAIVGAIVFIISFSVAYGPILWVFLFEIYPSEIRGAAAGAATAFNWIAGIIMVFVTNYMSNQIAYTLFAVMSGVSIAIVAILMRETKGRSIEDSPYLSANKSKA